MNESQSDKIHHQPKLPWDATLPPEKLAWDMAHAQARYRDAIYDKTHSEFRQPDESELRELAERALEISNAVEEDYYDKVAKRDEKYFVVEEKYGGVILNKEDLHKFIELQLGDSEGGVVNQRAVDQATTRTWNELGLLSERINSDISFAVTNPSGREKQPGTSKGNGWAKSEMTDYEGLNFASLLHFIDTMNANSVKPGGIRGMGVKTAQILLDFSEYVKSQHDQSEAA